MNEEQKSPKAKEGQTKVGRDRREIDFYVLNN